MVFCACHAGGGADPLARRICYGACLKRIVASLAGQALLLPCVLAVIWTAVWIHLGAEYQRAIQDAIERSTTLSQTLAENMRRSAAVLDNALLNSRAIYLHDKDGF